MERRIEILRMACKAPIMPLKRTLLVAAVTMFALGCSTAQRAPEQAAPPVAGLVGPQSYQGPAGPAGVQGAAGPTGVQGATLVGPTAAVGRTGSTGSQGVSSAIWVAQLRPPGCHS